MKPEDVDPKPFAEPVTLRIGGAAHSIETVRQAYDLLTGPDWPGEPGPRHRDASDTCLKVFDGHRSREEARRELLAAADEAGVEADG